MAVYRRRNTGGGTFGPIRPHDASDGWELGGDADEWLLTKAYGDHRGEITGTTRTTCAWRISRADGAMLREVSARSVPDAKAGADAWVREYLSPCDPA